MNKQLSYSATMVARPFLYIETKKLADLIVQGLSESEIKNKLIEENIFQLKAETRKKDIASIVLKRLKVLDEYLIQQIIVSDVHTSKLIVLYAIIKTDRLFYEFMNEVYSEKMIYQDLSLEDRDFNTFFEAKRQQSERVAKWKDYTFYKLQQVYMRILSEAGLLDIQKGNRKIIIPMVNPDVLEHIRDFDDPRYINVIVGGETEKNENHS